MSRLTVVDEIFLRTHRGMGTPIALQGLWRTGDRVEAELLREIHDVLREGPLGRRVVRPRILGARRGWRPNTRAHPLAIHPQPLTGNAVLPWADSLGADLDPEFAPGWRLAAASLADGGTVVALTCSHALADARGLIIAVDLALRGTARVTNQPLSTSGPDAAASRLEPDSAHQLQAAGEPRLARQLPTPAPARTERPAQHDDSDWSDAARQWSTVLRGTARALRRGIPPRPSAPPARTGPAESHSIVVRCPSAEWDRVAAEHGGTPNSLFIHLVANILWDSGFDRDTIDASLPVNTRHEPRVDNDLAVTEITVTRADTPATVRAKARAAYEHRMSSPDGMPEELLQVIPDRWAHALAKGAGERDILCSNIGTLPDSLRTLGPHPCTDVAARAIHPGLDPNHLPRTRLSAYLCEIAGTRTLTLTTLDPTLFPTPTTLLTHTLSTAHPLPLTPW
ncbi:hypothetical protein [Nocardia puris]|uniref:hypothetical protein n=1 Tax=Nocardia puris TaxID=208602 RepID=UPI001E504B24|nr:hypothetical protein [Nocardia puris]